MSKILDSEVSINNKIQNTECQFPIESSAHTAKMNRNGVEKCPDFQPESDLHVLKDVVCTTTSPTNTLGVSAQILIPTEDIDSLTQTVNFETASSVDILNHLSSKETTTFVDKQTVPTEDVKTSINITQTPNTINSMDDVNSVNTLNTLTCVNTMDTSSLPIWAAKLKDCELIGDSYRGYVNTEAELDLLLNIHKEHTNSCWGTRQSPSSAKPSVRLMWKSQYVPYDGVPFLNSGRRATVMECQYGPRRKGNKVKVQLNETGEVVNKSHKPTCTARIYVKKVRKFPEYRIDPNCERMAGTRQAQERALAALRQAGIENGGEERYYAQFPLEIAHQYHQEEDEVLTQPSGLVAPDQLHVTSGSRLDFRVTEKINELVARGVTGLYEVKHGVIQFVEKELFNSNVPPRHNKTYFPTITDIQNHIHQAKIALETGTLASLPPPETPPIVPRKCERNSKRKRTEPRRVRTPKTTFDDSIAGAIPVCAVHGEEMDMNGTGDLQNPTGTSQVYVMVPASNSLFSTSDSVLTSPLNSDKTPSLVQMQVVTVPVTASSYLGQQGDCSLSLAGQYLSLPVSALPVVSYSNSHGICDSAKNSTINDHLGKDIVSQLLPTNVGDRNMQQDISQHSETSTAPLSSSAITIYSADITMCENTGDSIIPNSLRPFEKSKDTILSTIEKNTAVNDLFVSESQINKPSSDLNADMNSIPCFTEESYNSSLDIIKSHSEITTPTVVVMEDPSQKDVYETNQQQAKV